MVKAFFAEKQHANVEEARHADAELQTLLTAKKMIGTMPPGPPSMAHMTSSIVRAMDRFCAREREIVMLHYVGKIWVEVQNWLSSLGPKPDPYAAHESSQRGADRHP